MNQLTTYDAQIARLEEPFNKILQDSGVSEITFRKEAHFALQLLDKNDFLVKTAQRNPMSLENAILNLAAIGLTLNPAEKKAYLVPRDGMVCLDIGYIGLVDLAISSGAVIFMQPRLVYQGDEFEYVGVGVEPVHKFNPFDKNRKEIIGVYCLTKLKTGEYLTEMMSVDECIAIRDRTTIWQKSKSGPWATDFGPMCLKTVVKRAAKLLPKSGNRLHKAIDVLNESEGIDFDAERKDEENRIRERQEKERIDYEYKDELIEEIKKLSATATKGFKAADKAKFVTNVLKVPTFNHLSKQSVEFLEETIERVKGEIDKAKTTVDVESVAIAQTTPTKSKTGKTAKDFSFKLGE